MGRILSLASPFGIRCSSGAVCRIFSPPPATRSMMLACRTRCGYYSAMTTHRRKPTRLSRVFQSYDPPLYFITMVTWRRQPLLNNDWVHHAFMEQASRQSRMNIGVGRYVIMPEHLHLFVRVGEPHKLSTTIKHLKEAVTKALRKKQPELRVWQPGFFDHLLRNSESYSEKWEYVRMNPVRAGLVDSAEDWPYQGEIVSIDRV